MIIKRREFLLGTTLSLVGDKALAFGQLGLHGLGFGKAGNAGSSKTNFRFGVNLSGAEFAPGSGQTFPSTTDASTLAALGVTFVRIPIAWESLQPTLNAALNVTYLNNLKSAISTFKAVGINTIVDLHNFAHWASATVWNTTVTYAGNVGVGLAGVQVFGDGTLTSAAFADVWTRLATALVGTAGLIGYDIMNEPANIAGNPNLLNGPGYLGSGNPVGAPWFNFNTGSMTQLAAGTNPIAGLQPAWKMSNSNFYGLAQSFSFAASQYTISCYAKAESGTIPFFFQCGGNDNSATPLTATTSWQRFSFTTTASAGGNNAGIIINTGTAGNLDVANFQLELAATPSTYVPNPFQSYAQAAITAIRAVDATTPIHVNGNNFNQASVWPYLNWDYVGLTGGNLIYHAHQYFDGPDGVGGGGNYSSTYTAQGVNPNSGVNDVTPFLNWLTTTGTTGFLGEFGVPNNATDNNPAWLPLQVNFLQALAAANIKGTQWFYGSNGIQPGNILNIGAVANDPRLIQMLSVK
jgi:hypothetical protein